MAQPTLPAFPSRRDKYPDPVRVRFWKRIVRSDARRTVHVLTLDLHGPNNETIEGDTALDGMYVITQLKDVSSDCKSDAWKALVNAGVITALCKCALTYQGAIMHPEGREPSQQEIEEVHRNMLSPYFLPLEVICNAFVSCAIPPTATEKKMLEDIKKHWSTIVQRIWSEPSRSLDLEPRATRTRERIVIPQLLYRLTMIDPAFLKVILKPMDLTFPVLVRSWMHAMDTGDTRMALGVLLPFISDRGFGPDNWKTHLAKHPAPPIQDLLPRVFLGASKTAGSDKKKRTATQTADAVVSAFAAHLEQIPITDLSWEYDFFHALFKHSMDHNRVFNRAVYRSARFWAANVSVLRRAAQHTGRERSQLCMCALTTFSTMPHKVDKDGKEAIDALVYNWLSARLFDAFEESIITCLGARGGPMIFTSIIGHISRYLPELSAKTRTLLRAQLPRPKLVRILITASAVPAGAGAREKVDKDYEELKRLGPDASSNNTMWLQAAWQMIASIMFSLEESGDCTRRTCETKRSAEAEEKELFVCE